MKKHSLLALLLVLAVSAVSWAAIGDPNPTPQPCPTQPVGEV